MKKVILTFLASLVLANLASAQVAVDSLNIIPSTFQKRTSAEYSFSQNDTVSLNILNSVGQAILSIKTDVILSSGFYQDSIIMDAYPDGMYFVYLKLGKRLNIVKKIIKTAFAGVSELSLFPEVKTYPNPVKTILFISTPQGEFENAKIEIINTLGQTVLKVPFNREINVSALSPGYYNLKVTTVSNQVYYSKIMKD